jgi:hypothetical protein
VKLAYDPAYGWRLDRVRGKRVERLPDGSVSLPLSVVLNGKHRGDGQLRMTPAEAEVLHAELCRALGGEGPHGGPPACRDSRPASTVRLGL